MPKPKPNPLMLDRFFSDRTPTGLGRTASNNHLRGATVGKGNFGRDHFSTTKYVHDQRGDFPQFETAVASANILENSMDMPPSKLPRPPALPPPGSTSPSTRATLLTDGVGSGELPPVIPPPREKRTATIKGIWEDSSVDAPRDVGTFAHQGQQQTFRLQRPTATWGGVAQQTFTQVTTDDQSKAESERESSLKLPSQRRREHEDELRQQEAQQALRGARRQYQRLNFSIRNRHPHGFLGGETADQLDSELYSDTHQRIAKHRARAETVAAARREYLRANDVKEGSGGPEIIHHKEEAPDPKAAKFLQSKHRGAPADTFHIREMAEAAAPKSAPRRLAGLQYNDTRGRTFNLLSGAAVPSVASPYQ